MKDNIEKWTVTDEKSTVTYPEINFNIHQNISDPKCIFVFEFGDDEIAMESGNIIADWCIHNLKTKWYMSHRIIRRKYKETGNTTIVYFSIDMEFEDAADAALFKLLGPG